MERKPCTTCGKNKPISDYYVYSHTGKPMRVCKKCHSKNVIANRDPDAYRQRQREYMRKTYTPKSKGL